MAPSLQAPSPSPAPPTGGPDGTFSLPDLQKIIRRQRAVNVSILLYILAFLLFCILPDRFQRAAQVVYYAAYISAGVCVFLLLLKIHGWPTTLLLAFLSMAPCVGLVVLLMVSHQATEILKRNGYTVGFFGAK